MKRLLLVVVAAALALPGTAYAKEIESVAVCGSNGCKAVKGAVQPFRDTFEGQGTANEPRTLLEGVALRSYYKIGIKIRGDRPPAGQFSLVMWFVPPNTIRFAGGVRDQLSEPFKEIPSALAAQLQAAASQLKPYPAPRVMKAYVNDERVDDARAYIHLFDKLPPTDATTDSGNEWVNIALTPDRANPWFADGLSLLYLNDAQSLFLAKPLKVSDNLADRIAADAGLPSPVHDSGAGWGRPVGLGILGVWLLIATVLFLGMTRHRRRTQPSTA